MSNNIISDKTKTIEDDNKENENIDSKESSMSFLGHIEELRKRVLISIIGVVVGCVISGIFINQILENIFLKPAIDNGLYLQNLVPFGQPFLYFKVILAVGIIISIPFTLYQLWLFLSPALYANERKWISRLTLLTSFCFFLGVIFSYLIMIPSMLNFAANFGTELIDNRTDINAYFSFISMMLLATGVVFELPILSFILSKMGIINSKFLSKYRRHSIIIILIIAAILTPTPDPISQIIFAFPIYLLYELSIFISYMTVKKQK